MSWVDRAWSTQINPICTAAGLSERYPAAAHIGRDIARRPRPAVFTLRD